MFQRAKVRNISFLSKKICVFRYFCCGVHKEKARMHIITIRLICNELGVTV